MDLGVFLFKFRETHLEGWDMLYNMHFMLRTTFVM